MLKKNIIIISCVLLCCSCAGKSIFSGSVREFEKGLSFFNSGQYEKAVPYFIKAIELDPEYGKAHLYLGRAYLNLGKWPQAIQPLRSAYTLSPSETQKETLNFLIDAFFGAAVSELKMGNFQNAIGYLNEGMTIDPQSSKIKSQLADTLISYAGNLLSERKTSSAIDSYKQAAELMPRNLDAYVGLVRAFLQRGEFMEAMNYAKQAQKIDPGNEIVQALLFQLLKMQ